MLVSRPYNFTSKMDSSSTESENYLVETFYLDTHSSQCGYPICCPGQQPKFKEVPFFPTKVTDLGIEYELKQFMQACDDIFHKTGMPMFPCLCHHFCLPFSPVCAALYCASKRKSELDEVLRSFNAEVAQPKGIFLQWNDAFQFLNGGRSLSMESPGLEVWINVIKRAQICLERGLNSTGGFVGNLEETPLPQGPFLPSPVGHFPYAQPLYGPPSTPQVQVRPPTAWK